MNDSKPHLVIDGDLQAFAASSVHERRYIIAAHKTSGVEMEFKTRTEMKACVQDYNEWDIRDVQEPRPFPLVAKLADELIDKWMAQADAASYEIVLSGPTNFRLDIPLPKPAVINNGNNGRYKGNRANGLRPVMLAETKQWLIDKYNTSVSDGVEADDVLAMKAYAGWKAGKKIVQVTIDKDALGCQGWYMHMDDGKPPQLIEGFGGLELVEKADSQGRVKRSIKGRGNAWWLCQSVFKDDADNYRAADLSGQKFGDVECYNLLKDAKNEAELVEIVYKQFKKWYPEPVTYTAWDEQQYTKNAADIWQMYIDCAKMQRWPGDRTDVRKVLKYYGIVE